MPTAVHVNGASRAFGYEAITVSTTPIGPTVAAAFPKTVMGGYPAKYQDQGADSGVFTIETDQVRYTIDGTQPNASVGHLLNVGDVLTIDGRDNLSRLLFRRVTTDASIKATYFRRT